MVDTQKQGNYAPDRINQPKHNGHTNFDYACPRKLRVQIYAKKPVNQVDQRCDICDANSGDEEEVRPVVFFADACANHVAVMVKILDTSIAKFAVACSLRSEDVARGAVLKQTLISRVRDIRKKIRLNFP